MAKSTLTLPTLYKRVNNGVQEWQISVVDRKDGTAEIVTRYGLVDGKHQVTRDVIEEGKNVGKRNETTAREQAILEARAEHKKKINRKHYGTDPDAQESAEKRSVAPMLAYPYQKHFKKVDWSLAWMQKKYDGNRMLARNDDGKITLWTREGVQIQTLPHIVDGLGKAIKDGEVLDGEAYIHGLHVTNLRSMMTRAQDDCEKVQFRVYDVLVDMSYDERLDIITRRVEKADETCVVQAETTRVRCEADLMKFQAECIEEGYEGAMLRHGNKGYEAGKRSDSLLKVKTFQDEEFKIVGVKQGRGTFTGMAIFICETLDGHRFDVTAPGTHEVKKMAWENRDDFIGSRVTVKFADYTETEAPVPFHPVAIAIRD